MLTATALVAAINISSCSNFRCRLIHSEMSLFGIKSVINLNELLKRKGFDSRGREKYLICCLEQFDSRVNDDVESQEDFVKRTG